MAVRAIIFGDDDQARRIPVEPVHDARTSFVAHAFEIGRVSQHRVDQRAAGVAGCRMYDHPRRFVNHDQIAVFVDDVERDRFGCERGGRGRRDGDDDLIAVVDALAGFGNRHVVDGDEAVVNQSLNLRAGEIGDGIRQVAVNPVASRFDEEADDAVSHEALQVQGLRRLWLCVLLCHRAT